MKITNVPRIMPRLNNINNSNKNAVFTGFSPLSDQNFNNEVVFEPVETMTGNISVTNSEMNGKISTMSGNIVIKDSTIKAEVSNIGGKTEFDNSIAEKNITNTAGEMTVYESIAKNDINNIAGKLWIVDSQVEGTVKCPLNLLFLGSNSNGGNTLNNVILTEPIAKTASKTFNMNNGSIMISNFSMSTINFSDGNRMISNTSFNTDNLKPSDEPIEFKITPDDKILGIFKFETEKPGVLIIERGAKFAGKLINGTIKYLK